MEKIDTSTGLAPPIYEGTCHCGSSRWRFVGNPQSTTACNCTLCRKYAALWAYGFEGEEISISGTTNSYTRIGKANPALEILFCTTCGCVLCWCGMRLDEQSRRRMAVNLRLAEPQTVEDLPIDHFDGLDSFDDLPRDNRCVRDMWF